MMSLLQKIKKTLFREKYAFLAFAISWILLLCFASEAQLAPFGNKCLLAMDLHGQYYPMMWEKLSDFFSVWSWDGALGFSTVAQSAYYTNSIFLVLLLPFSGYVRIAALHGMIFLKIALSAAALTHYLGRKFEKYDLLTAVFGVAYGLGAYTLAYLNQPMWLDIVLFCPIVLCALERLLLGGSPIPYVLTLALAVFSNFYISFALCLFLAIRFVVYVILNRWAGFRDILKISARFALASVASGLLCAFTLIPLLLHMENWISASVGFPEQGEWYHDFSEIADSFSAFVPTSLEFGPANVFCGSASIFLVLTYLFNTRISLKKRIVMLSLAVFLFVSFEWSYLDFIWHGLHFPNQLPGRQSFLFILVVSLIGYENAVNFDGVGFFGTIASLFTSAAFFLFQIAESENARGRLITVMVIAVVFLIFAIGLAVKRSPIALHFVRSALAVVLLADICVHASYVLEKSTALYNAPDYLKNEEQMLLYAKKYQSADDDFYRSEMTPNYTFNCGQLYGFKGVTYYSSTMNGRTYALMERLGNRVYAKNVSTVYMPTPLQDMMFDVKYHYMNGARTLSYAKRLEKANGISVYESPYALSVAYAVDPDIRSIADTSATGLHLQEEFIRLATKGKQPLLRREKVVQTFVSNGEYLDGCLYVRDVESAARYTVEYAVHTDGYFYLDFDFTVGTYEVSVNEGSAKTGHCGADQLLEVGYVTPGDHVTVTVTTRGYAYAEGGVSGYTIEENALLEARAKLSKEVLQVEYASDTVIRGEITVGADRVLYASVPAENGWSVYIDGKKAEIYDLGMGLCFCDIEAGTHTVEYRYRAPGLAFGIVVSSVTAVCVAMYGVWELRKRRA